MKATPFHHFKPLSEEQLRALDEKNGWVGKERAVEPEEVGITPEMLREARLAAAIERMRAAPPFFTEAEREALSQVEVEAGHSAFCGNPRGMNRS